MDACYLDIGMKIDTFVDFIYTYTYIHCCPIHQIDIPPAQILSSRSTISSKALAEMVLLSNNSISDMSCFLRASVLLSKEQSGTVDMANKYKLASILTIYINHSTANADRRG